MKVEGCLLYYSVEFFGKFRVLRYVQENSKYGGGEIWGIKNF